MKCFTLIFSIVLAAVARAESLRLILVPEQIIISSDVSPVKFDLFLYNAGDSVRTVPALEQFRAFYTLRAHDNSTLKSGTDVRAFSHRIKDHALKARGANHASIEIDLPAERWDYIEVHVQIGHDERALTSNSVVLLNASANSTPTASSSSPTPAVTPNR